MKLSPLRRLVFSLLPALILLAGAELGLRLVGFHFQRTLSYMQFAYPNPGLLHDVYTQDPLLFWRIKPHFDFGHGYPKLNSQGFRGPDFNALKTPGTFRVACLGDSVTFGLAEADYPSLLQNRLARRRPDRKIEVMNFGVPGYSSWQGRRLLTSQTLALDPDLVVIFFGWNDHWLVQGFSDHEQKVRASPRLIRVRDGLARLRTYQALNLLLTKFRPAAERQEKLRVPPDRYRDNLRAMVRDCRERGVAVVLATAPAGSGLDTLPDYLTALGFIRANADLEPLHRQYNQIAREVGREENAPVADLEAVFQTEGVKNFFDHPDRDIIHPNARGLELIVRTLAEAIAAARPEAGGK